MVGNGEQEPAPVVVTDAQEAEVAARVAAEVARVEAKRTLARAFRLMTIGYLVLSLVVGLAFVFTWLNDRETERNRRERISQINQINASQCQALQNLYTVIRKTLTDADKAIDELSYYKQFPLERTAAHARNETTLSLFRVPACPPKFEIPND